MSVRRWDELTSPELQTWAQRDPVVVLPLAAVEQHGPHLPLATDRIIGQGVLDAALTRISEDVPVLRLPTQDVGTSAEHEDFPGTLSLDPATLDALVFDIGASLAAAGVRRLVVANSHGGNRPVLDLAALRLRQAFDMLVVKASYFRFPRADEAGLPESEWAHGLHGGAVETALMLHLRPDLVRADELRAFDSLGRELEDRLEHVGPEGAAPFAWSAGDLADEGVVGDATLADADMGARLLGHYASVLAETIEDAYRFPLERLRRHGDSPGR